MHARRRWRGTWWPCAAANGTGRAPAAGRTFFVSRPSGRLPYEVLVVPLTSGSAGYRIPASGTVMMLISDPLEAFAIPFHQLVDDYGLDPRGGAVLPGVAQ